MEPYPDCPTCKKGIAATFAVMDFSKFCEETLTEFLKQRPTSALCNDCLAEEVIKLQPNPVGIE